MVPVLFVSFLHVSTRRCDRRKRVRPRQCDATLMQPGGVFFHVVDRIKVGKITSQAIVDNTCFRKIGDLSRHDRVSGMKKQRTAASEWCLILLGVAHAPDKLLGHLYTQ